MKDIYHFCFTSHNEVLFRSKEDIGMYLNLLALRAYDTGTTVLVDTEMSTHTHSGILCSLPRQFAARLRMSYNAFFNYKYQRKGPLGEPGSFVLTVSGFNHIMVLFNYILRNGLHHGVAATAMGYPYCSIREQFTEELGFAPTKAARLSRGEIRSALPRHSRFPDSYQMDGNGIFLRRSFMEPRIVEQYYTTPRNYLYQMNKLSGEDWLRQQEQDGTGRPLILDDVERGFQSKDIQQMLLNEKGKSFKKSEMTDLDVCELIDRQLLPGMHASSIYTLDNGGLRRIARTLRYEFRLGPQQIGRCLGGYTPGL